MNTIAVDWDGTLVDPKTQAWLPGAKVALHQLLSQHRHVIIHTSRANWLEGRVSVESKLAEAVARPWETSLGERLKIEPKPNADVYVDDRAIRFTGNWLAALRQINLLEEKR